MKIHYSEQSLIGEIDKAIDFSEVEVEKVELDEKEAIRFLREARKLNIEVRLNRDSMTHNVLGFADYRGAKITFSISSAEGMEQLYKQQTNI